MITLSSVLASSAVLLAVIWALAAADKSQGLTDDGTLKTLLLDEPVLHLNTLGAVSDSEDNLVRTYLSPAHKRAAVLVEGWMQEAGLQTHIDVLGNVRGRVESGANLPALLLGSHYDTVLDAGKYDGPLGVIVSIAALKALLLQAACDSGILSSEEVTAAVQNRKNVSALLAGRIDSLLLAPVEVIAFADEEGVRLQSTFLGSRALAGTFLRHDMLASEDKRGVNLSEILRADGYAFDGSEGAIARLALAPEAVQGYVEVHIEQGLTLEGLDVPVAPVRAIAGQTRLAVMFKGVQIPKTRESSTPQGHAGAVTMAARRDPVAAAAECMFWLERRCAGHSLDDVPAEALEDPSLVCTVGEVDIHPGASNVIAKYANISVDIRVRRDDVRQRVVDDFVQHVAYVCRRRGIECEAEVKHVAPAVACDAGMVQALQRACVKSQQALERMLAVQHCAETAHAEARAPSGQIGALGSCVAVRKGPRRAGAALTLVSGAGHDALALADLTKVAMLFVRNRGGVSHSPEEHVEPKDVAAAGAALLMFLRERLLPTGASP